MLRVPLTVRGSDKLQAELTQLKTIDRPRIISSIADAREHGDLKENAEYHAAREEQGFVEGRIQEIESKLGMAQVIDVTKLPQTGRVVFGTTVTLENVDTEATVTYQIVGDDEASVEDGRISVNSPIARALIGKEEGDEVSVRAPGGDQDYEIMAVQYI